MNPVLLHFLAVVFSFFLAHQTEWDRPVPAVDVGHYRFDLSLTDSVDQITGKAGITVTFRESGVESFDLDLVGRESGGETGMTVERVTREGRDLRHIHAGHKLSVFTAPTPEIGEERTYQVDYRGIPADGLIIGRNMYGDRTFFGDNWPERARHWLPTVDHPSDKATVEWVVTAPSHYQVVANGRRLESRDLENGEKLTRWATAAPIPTKVMVIGVARFAVDTSGTVGEVPVEAWVYPQNRREGFSDFARATRALRFFHERVGPFPYQKLANVQSKTRYGGMENAGAIFYSERAVRGDGRNESLIVHEVAHQWFGDSVTECDWPHIWLSEGFATYMTHLYMEETYGPEMLISGMERDRRTIRRFHAQYPGLPLVPLDLTDPNAMLNPNAYQKGAWVLHMLRRQVGDEAFWRGIRSYYREYRDSNAVTEDLRRVMEEESGQDLGWFVDQWAYRPGYPLLEGEWSYDEDTGQLSLSLRQAQPHEAAFRFPLDIGVETAEASARILGTVEVAAKAHTFTFKVDKEPEALILDPGTWLLFEGELRRTFSVH